MFKNSVLDPITLLIHRDEWTPLVGREFLTKKIIREDQAVEDLDFNFD